MRRLQTITGLEVKKLSEGCYGIYMAPSVAFFSFLKDEKKACEDLRRMNWARVIREAGDRCEWKCERCGKRSPLQGHHKIYRSRWSRADGPLDVLANVSMLCQNCHEEEHRPAPSTNVNRPSDDLNDIDKLLDIVEREDEPCGEVVDSNAEENSF